MYEYVYEYGRLQRRNHFELKEKTVEGKRLFADAERMLVAWQRSLTEE